VTESDLMRRYGLTKVQLATLLRRIVNEGWIERLPGHGWQFLPILTSGETYDQAYRFRILIESAALNEPRFRVDEAALRKCLAEQQALIDGAVEWASPAQLFDANTRLHETIASFSGNVFIVESLKRINRLRRLMEYRKAVDREAAARRCREHKTLIELLLSGQREAAADFIRLHLRDAAREKAMGLGVAKDD
jgi:DNA-binding GntR family transcriptional regulator